ncbi:hypothetical protein, partial [Microbacterium sp. 69-10]|uniref:hypothetical protein n=1 Tax=Microbacterium sp. 69-10 TaxID=1895783 RepID=UPI0025CE6F80
PAAKRIAVSPSTSYWITSRRAVAVAVGSSGSLDGRFNITGYDSTGSHRSNGFTLTWGSAPTVGTEIIDQQITTPDWVVSLELNWYTGGNNGDKVVWDRIGILTAPGYFDGGYSPDPDLTASWTGPANASASILTGVPVAGATLQSTAVAYRSLSTPGGMTMRTSRENYSRVQYSIPGSGSRTTLLTLSSPAPRLVYMETGGQVTPVPLPGGGTEVPVWVGAVWTNGYFYVGNRPDVPTADRDIPVTVRKPGVFAGDYTGPAFSGADPASGGYRYYWQDAPNASPSVRFQVLAPLPDMAPVPRILVDVVPSQFPPGAVTVGLTRTAEGRTFDVRGGQRLPAGSPAVVTDSEAPFGLESTYTVVGYDADGNVVGSLPAGSVTLDCDLTVVQQPLDARLSAVVRRQDGTAAELVRSTPGEVMYPQGKVVPGLVGLGPRRGLAGVPLDLTCDADQVEALQASLGTYEVPQLPVWLVRTPPDDTGGTRLPAVFFCHVPELVEVDAWRHTGTGWSRFRATVTEVSPPAPGITATVLTHSDVKALFTTHSEVKAQYATHSDLKRDTSLIGAADA